MGLPVVSLSISLRRPQLRAKSGFPRNELLAFRDGLLLRVLSMRYSESAVHLGGFQCHSFKNISVMDPSQNWAALLLFFLRSLLSRSALKKKFPRSPTPRFAAPFVPLSILMTRSLGPKVFATLFSGTRSSSIRRATSSPRLMFSKPFEITASHTSSLIGPTPRRKL